jgi:hypothetical protein
MKLSTDFIVSAAKVATKCRRDKTFCIDDIRKIAERKGMDVKPQSWGMSVMRAYTQGRIKPVRMLKSARASNHGRQVMSWRLS